MADFKEYTMSGGTVGPVDEAQLDALVGRFFHRLLDRRFRRRIDGGFIGGVVFRAAGGEKQNQDEGKCGDFE